MTGRVEHLGGVAQDVAEHVHGWRLRTVDYVDGVVSHGFECEGCDAVRFT